MLKRYQYFFGVVLVAVTSLLLFVKFWGMPYLQFSDAAKTGEVAKSIYNGTGYATQFIQFTNNPQLNREGLFSARTIPPLVPYLTFLSFKLFGVTDISIKLVSMLFYLLSVVLTYALGKKIFNSKVGVFAAAAVATNISFINYAASGASETVFVALFLFMFLMFSYEKMHFLVLGGLAAGLLFSTRAHAPFYVLPAILFLLLKRFNSFKKPAIIISILLILALGYVGLSFVNPKVPGAGIIKERIIVALAHNSSFAPANDALRMNQPQIAKAIIVNIPSLIKKFFYNLYNFYKLIPDIYSPYLFCLFILGFFIKSDSAEKKYFKYSTTLLFFLVFAAVALTAPLFRYLHPLIPIIYLTGSYALVSIGEKLHIKNYLYFLIALILFIGQFIGYVFLDSRFEKNLHDYSKAPIYLTLSNYLKEYTQKGDTVMTNLDTWGSWYGDRKTIWYSLTPEELKNSKIEVNAIYLTSYLMDDENSYMGDAWRQIFNNPYNLKDKYLSENFKLKGIYQIGSEDTFEKSGGKGVLLVRK